MYSPATGPLYAPSAGAFYALVDGNVSQDVDTDIVADASGMMLNPLFHPRSGPLNFPAPKSDTATAVPALSKPVAQRDQPPRRRVWVVLAIIVLCALVGAAIAIVRTLFFFLSFFALEMAMLQISTLKYISFLFWK